MGRKKCMLLDGLRDIENKALDTMGKARGEGQDQGMGWRHAIYYKASRAASATYCTAKGMIAIVF